MKKIVIDVNQIFQNDIVGESVLFPCSVCGRTFSKSSLERHARVCEKVKSTPKRKVFNVEKLGEDLKVRLSVFQSNKNEINYRMTSITE